MQIFFTNKNKSLCKYTFFYFKSQQLFTFHIRGYFLQQVLVDQKEKIILVC